MSTRLKVKNDHEKHTDVAQEVQEHLGRRGMNGKLVVKNEFNESPQSKHLTVVCPILKGYIGKVKGKKSFHMCLRSAVKGGCPVN